MAKPAKPKRGRPPKGDRPMTSAERSAASRARALDEAAKPKGTIEALVAEWNAASDKVKQDFLSYAVTVTHPLSADRGRQIAPPGSLLKGQK